MAFIVLDSVMQLHINSNLKILFFRPDQKDFIEEAFDNQQRSFSHCEYIEFWYTVFNIIR